MPIEIIRQDITKVKADIIVNTANPKPVIGTGVDSAIYLAAGIDELLKERELIGVIEPGDGKVTNAYNLDAKYIIHTVGPSWTGGNNNEIDILKSCYEKCLDLCLELNCKSIAFPLISTGNYGFPLDKALSLALSIINPFLLIHDIDVTIAVFSNEAVTITSKIFNSIREFVDSDYVDEAIDYEYRNNNFRRTSIDDIEFVETKIKPTKDAKYVYIDKLLEEEELTFSEKLMEIIIKKDLTNKEVYEDYLTKQVFSKIISNKDYHPNKYVALALCLSLKLDLTESKDLISRAGYSFNPSNKLDKTIMGCIRDKIYRYDDVNYMLEYYGFKTINEYYKTTN